MKHILCLLLLCNTVLVFAQNDIKFEEANTLYNDANYEEAINIYKTILDTGNHSAALYYNLGNAYYKLNKIGPSIYYFEKALQLAPNDEDILNNLAFSKNMTIDAIETLPKTQVALFVEKIVGTFSYNQWAWIGVVFAFICMLLFILYNTSYQSAKKRLYFIGSAIALFIVIGSVIFAYKEYNKALKDHPAIIFATETKVTSEPNVRSEEVFILHEGTKVQVLEHVKDWKKIRLSDGKTGWMIAEDLKEL